MIVRNRAAAPFGCCVEAAFALVAAGELVFVCAGIGLVSEIDAMSSSVANSIRCPGRTIHSSGGWLVVVSEKFEVRGR